MNGKTETCDVTIDDNVDVISKFARNLRACVEMRKTEWSDISKKYYGDSIYRINETALN